MLGDEGNLPKRNTYLGCDDFCWVSSFFLGGLGSLKIQTNKRWVMLFGVSTIFLGINTHTNKQVEVFDLLYEIDGNLEMLLLKP